MKHNRHRARQSLRFCLIIGLLVLVTMVSFVLLSSPHATLEVWENDDAGQGGGVKPNKQTRGKPSQLQEKSALVANRSAVNLLKGPHSVAENVPENVPPSLVTDEGLLTTAAAEAAGLSEAERNNVDIAARDMWKSLAMEFNDRVTFDRGDFGPDIAIFRVPAMGDRGTELRQNFQNRLGSIVDATKQHSLLSGVGEISAFGGGGRYDVTIEYYPSRKSYRYEYRDPKTGREIMSGTEALELSESRFGSLLDLQNRYKNAIGGGADGGH